MKDLVKKNQEGLIEYLKWKELGLDLPKPYQRDIYLLEVIVAGTTQIENIEEIAASLDEGTRLNFYREPDNQHDPQAIRVETTTNKKIGYIPQQDNLVLSRLMDGGKILFGKVKEKDLRGKWLMVKIKIYLLDN